jgi:hypothetical protein
MLSLKFTKWQEKRLDGGAPRRIEQNLGPVLLTVSAANKLTDVVLL